MNSYSLHVMYFFFFFLLSPVLMWLWDVNKKIFEKYLKLNGKCSIFMSCSLLRLEKRYLILSVRKKPALNRKLKVVIEKH